MTIYAVMKTGGKEYRVAPGDLVRVEKLEAAPGATVEIREVRLIEDGQDVAVGSPTVPDASVIAEVIEEGRGEKIVSFRKKRRNHYQMTIDDMRSYTILRIREIAVGKSVRERKVPAPQAKNPPNPPTPPTPSTPTPIEVPPPVAAQGDAPVAPHPVHAVEVQALAPSAIETPPARMTPLPRVEIAAPAPVLAERGPRKRSYGIPALVVALLVIATGLLLWGGRQTRVSAEAAVEVAPVAATPQMQASVPQPAAKAPPRSDTAIKKPVAASAPSAPVQPPE